jgi:hypothetical protein
VAFDLYSSPKASPYSGRACVRSWLGNYSPSLWPVAPRRSLQSASPVGPFSGCSLPCSSYCLHPWSACFKRRWLSRAATVAASVFILIWAALVILHVRPGLRIAMQPVVPYAADIDIFTGTPRPPGLETADLELTRRRGLMVDRMGTGFSLDPRHYPSQRPLGSTASPYGRSLAARTGCRCRCHGRVF